MHALSQNEAVQLHFNQLASTKTGGILIVTALDHLAQLIHHAGIGCWLG